MKIHKLESDGMYCIRAYSKTRTCYVYLTGDGSWTSDEAMADRWPVIPEEMFERVRSLQETYTPGIKVEQLK